MENLTMKQKMIYVLKKYGYYFLLGIMLAGILATIIAVSVSSSSVEEEPNAPTSSAVTPFMPVANATVYKGYYGDSLCFNETLKQWETHKAIDFQVASGSGVYATLDGVVKDVYTNLLEGTVVVLEHDGGLVSTYGSLDSDVKVNVGDMVNRGDQIGVVSNSATCEASADAHLHFVMEKNGQKVDPSAYLNISNK